MRIELVVNEEASVIECDPRETLLSALRERLELPGTKYGCGEGECGSCTVLVDGHPITSCLTMIGQVAGRHVTTVEGVETDSVGRSLVDAFAETGAVQCGFCTPGFVLTARSLLAGTSQPDRADAREAIAGNLCRCTGYTKIVDAIVAAGVELNGNGDGHGDEATGTEATGPQTDLGGRVTADEFTRPSTVAAVLTALDTREAPMLVCGGTDIGVRYENRLKEHRFIDLTAVDELDFVDETETSISIGSATPYRDIIESPAVRRHAPVLVLASKEVGATQIQNLGTLGGNIANASPAADGVPALVVHGASVVIRSAAGERVVHVDEVATGPGTTTLAANELITEIVIPTSARPGSRRVCFFQKHGPRRMQTIAVGSVTFDGWLDGDRLRDVRIALGAVARTIIRAPETEALLMAAPLTLDLVLEAGRTAQSECSPIDDIRGSAAFRSQLIRGLLVKGLIPFVPETMGTG